MPDSFGRVESHCFGCESVFQGADAQALAERVFTCACGHVADRDLNAAVNLARWGQTHHQASPSDPRTPKPRGRATNARRRDGTDQHPTRAGETSPNDAGTDVHTAPAA